MHKAMSALPRYIQHLKRINKYKISCRFSSANCQMKANKAIWYLKSRILLPAINSGDQLVLITIYGTFLSQSFPCRMLYVRGGEGREKISKFHLHTHPTHFERGVVDLYAGCYPIMPCRCTRPYSPRVFLYTVCLSALRCISKRKRAKVRKMILKKEYV